MNERINNYIFVNGLVGYAICAEKKLITIALKNNVAGFYCRTGFNLYGAFANTMNLNVEKRDWSIAFTDLGEWFIYSENGCVLDHLFEPYDNVAANIKKDSKIILPGWGHHNLHRHKELVDINQYFTKCFKPNKSLEEHQTRLEKKYNIDYENTLGVCFRGTDKHTEVSLAEPAVWITAAKDILKTNKNLRIFIQTDQEQVRDLFVNEFKSDCFFVEEMPVTTTNTVIHQLKLENFDKLGFTKNLNCVVQMLSKCKFLVNHTGNTGKAISVYRGTAENLWQIDGGGQLVSTEYLNKQ